MRNFSGEYAKQYDHIHGEKNYEVEVERIIREIKLRGIDSPCSILDFGCGTGSHVSLLREHGFNAWGYDINPDMILVARNKGESNRNYFTSEFRELDQHFDAVYSLFDVVNYQVSDLDLQHYLDQLDSKLRSGGLLVLDSWNKEAVIKDPPRKSSRTYLVDGKEYLRTVLPTTRDNFQNTKLAIELIDVELSQLIKREEHNMRAYSSLELSERISNKGYTDIRVFEVSDWNSTLLKTSWRFGISAIKC